MRLYDEIFQRLGGADLVPGARYTVLPGRGGYFQGVKAIAEFSDGHILLAFSRFFLEAEGSGFEIAKYCEGDLELRGNIGSVRLKKGREER